MGANATKGNGVWDTWLEADQAVCFSDGSGVGRQARSGCSQNITAEATRRLEILKFRDKHGIAATLDAHKVSKRTLYRWQQFDRQARGIVTALSNQSRAPKRRRTQSWPHEVMTKLRKLRQSYPSLGAEKLRIFLTDWCEPRNLACPKTRTVMRLIAERPELKKAKPSRLKVAHRKTTQRVAAYHEDLLFTALICSTTNCLITWCGLTPSTLIVVLGYYHLMSI